MRCSVFYKRYLITLLELTSTMSLVIEVPKTKFLQGGLFRIADSGMNSQSLSVKLFEQLETWLFTCNWHGPS